MEVLWNNIALRAIILDGYDPSPQTNDVILVNCITSLREVANTTMSVSAVEEKAREKRLTKAWRVNSESEKHINGIRVLEPI